MPAAAIDNRLDQYLARCEERERRAIAERQAQEDAERRERSKRWAESCAKHQAAYADSYKAFGQVIPSAVFGEAPGDYRRRLAQGLIDKLSRRDPLAAVRADDLDGATIKIVEPQILAAAQREGYTPSWDNLPEDGSLIQRERIDPQTGERRIEFFARESFIKRMMPPRRRAIIADPRALYGQARLSRSFMPQSVVTVVGG